MTNFLMAAGVVVGIAVFCGLGYRALESDTLRAAAPWLAGMGLLVTVVIGAAANADDSAQAQGPCIREATGWAYNAATKTTMPYTYCAERGTWAKP